MKFDYRKAFTAASLAAAAILTARRVRTTPPPRPRADRKFHHGGLQRGPETHGTSRWIPAAAWSARAARLRGTEPHRPRVGDGYGAGSGGVAASNNPR